MRGVRADLVPASLLVAAAWSTAHVNVASPAAMSSLAVWISGPCRRELRQTVSTPPFDHLRLRPKQPPQTRLSFAVR